MTLTNPPTNLCNLNTLYSWLYDVKETVNSLSVCCDNLSGDVTQNLFYASPNGMTGQPSFRVITLNDIPNLNTNKITAGVLLHERGGLEADVSGYSGLINITGGVTSNIKINLNGALPPTNNDDALIGYSIGSLWYDTISQKAYTALDVTIGAAVWKEITSVGAGTVTSVGLSLPSEFTISNSPVNVSGTLTGVWSSQLQNLIFASPNGVNGVPTFRGIASADLTTALTTPPPIGGTTPNSGAFTTLTGTGATVITSNAIGTKPLTVKGFSGQTANLFEAQDSTGAVVASVTSSGAVRSFLSSNYIQLSHDSIFNPAIVWSGGNGVVLRSITAGANSTRLIPYADALYSLGGPVSRFLSIYAVTGFFTANDATTNAVTNVIQLTHNTTGTPANGIGTGLLFSAESSTTITTQTSRITSQFTDVTHASRKTELRLLTSDASAEREGIRIGANGSATTLGFYGAAATTQQTVTGSRTDGTALASLLTALANLGLIIDSSTA